MGKVLKILEANPRLADFDLFWECYPKKRAKLDALKAWKQTSEIRPDIEKIIAAIDTQEQWVDWQRDGGQWIPLPASWLRGGRWDDE